MEMILKAIASVHDSVDERLALVQEAIDARTTTRTTRCSCRATCRFGAACVDYPVGTTARTRRPSSRAPDCSARSGHVERRLDEY